MADVVNLGRARKRKREEAERRRADENAIRHGRTKAEKARERMEQAKLRAAVDGARRAPAAAPTPLYEGAGTEPPALATTEPPALATSEPPTPATTEPPMPATSDEPEPAPAR